MSTDNASESQNLTAPISQPYDGIKRKIFQKKMWFNFSEDSPVGPLETREIENATESDDSDTTTHEYSPYMSEVEEENEIASKEQILEPPPGPNDEISLLEGLATIIDVLQTSFFPDVGPGTVKNEDEAMECEDNEQAVQPSVFEEETDEIQYDETLEDAVYDTCDEEEIEYEEEEQYEDEEADADDEDEGSENDELVDLNDDEEVTFDPDYSPTTIPPLVESDPLKMTLPTLSELQAAIQEGDDFPFALLDDFQLDLENYMRLNLYKQLSIIDEISKLLTNAPAQFDFDQLPNFADEELPVESIPMWVYMFVLIYN